MDSLPELTTQRLRLWVAGPEDAEELLRFYQDSRDHLQPWMPATPPGFETLEFWQKRLESSRRDCLSERVVRFVISARDIDPDRIIGICNIGNIARGPVQSCQIGYSLERDAQGRGFMTEALGAIIDFAFRDLKLHRIQANYNPGNTRSGAVLKRLGFAVEGYARDYLLVNGVWQDHLMTALVNPRAFA